MDIRVGIDIGGVIIAGKRNDPADTSFFGVEADDPAFFKTPSVFDAIEGVKTVVEKVGPNNTFIISRCGPLTAGRSLLWLSQSKFYELTGFKKNINHIRLCQERAEKTPIAAELGLTHYIDNEPEVLVYMQGVVENRVLFGPKKAPANAGLLICPTWKDIRQHL